MIKALLDSNIILDIALERAGFYEGSFKIFENLNSGTIVGYITATSIKDIYFVIQKEKERRVALEFIWDLTSILEVLSVDKNTIFSAMSSNFFDFEDSIQNSAAEINKLDWIITRNKKDFKKSNLAVLTPKEVLERLEL